MILDTDKINQMFGNNFQLESEHIARYLPIFHEKLQRKTPLKMHISYKDPKVQFGVDDIDIILEYKFTLSVRTTEHGAKEMFYDELKVI